MDIAQDTFVKLFASIRDFRGDSSFDTWIYRLVVNSCMDHRRRSWRILPLADHFHQTLRAPDDSLSDLLRSERGRLEPVDWPGALEAFVARFRAIGAEYGPEAVAFLGTGQIATEELALLGALAKFGMGMVHGDGNRRIARVDAGTVEGRHVDLGERGVLLSSL